MPENHIEGIFFIHWTFFDEINFEILLGIFFSGMNFRKRNEAPKPLKKKTKTKAVAIPSTHSKPKPCTSVQTGQIVLFRMSGYCEWPARVIGIDGRVVEVRFFGDNKTWKSTSKDIIYRYEDCADLIVFNLRRRKTKDYYKAVKEVEIALGVPESLSILTQFGFGN